MKLAILLIIFALLICFKAFAQEPVPAYTNTQIVNAIYKAEGGLKATYLYGIRFVNYDTPQEARQICLNTVRNHKKRHLSHDDSLTYLECLSRRYAPLNAKNDRKGLNKNWLRLVIYFLEQNGGTK